MEPGTAGSDPLNDNRMKLRHYFPHFKEAFFHPRVFIFMLAGVVVMLLTFFTDDNALEIAISGIASVFIGIGINNLTSLEMHLKEEQKLRSRMGHLLTTMGLVQSRLRIIAQELNQDNGAVTKAALIELEQIVGLVIGLIREEAPLP
jgi:hypothetical protein